MKIAYHPLEWFIGQIKHYMSGKGNPIILMLGWWLLLNVVSFSVGLAWSFPLNHPGQLVIFVKIISFIMGILGLIIAFIYPFILVVSLWKCAFNVPQRWMGYMNRLLMIPILMIQIYLALLYALGALGFIAFALFKT